MAEQRCSELLPSFVHFPHCSPGRAGSTGWMSPEPPVAGREQTTSRVAPPKKIPSWGSAGADLTRTTPGQQIKMCKPPLSDERQETAQ